MFAAPIWESEMAAPIELEIGHDGLGAISRGETTPTLSQDLRWLGRKAGGSHTCTATSHPLHTPEPAFRPDLSPSRDPTPRLRATGTD